ncbi:MAG: T9SS type A sorting domain-containing protein [Saprospiraceae bacterium]|nr:T9SS type A sorting domain-containing protein [Saprospiraceae bacterium]
MIVRNSGTIFSLLLILLTNDVLQSQFKQPIRPFEQINFPELNTVWQTTSFDSGIIGDTCDGYNFFSDFPFTDLNYLIDENFIFRVLIQRGTSYRNGTYLEKINIHTGQLMWQKYYGVGVDAFREFGVLIYFNEDNNIEVISQLFPFTHSPTPIVFTNMVFTKRIYDYNTGALLSFEKPDFDDSDLIKSIYSLHNSNSFYKEKNDEGFRYFYGKRDSVTLESIRVNAVIRNQTKKSEIRENYLYYKYEQTLFPNKPYRISDDSFLILEVISSLNKVVFRYTDADYNILDEFISDSFDPTDISNLFIDDYNPENKTILLINRIRPTDPFDDVKVELYVFNESAELLRRIKLPVRYSPNFKVIHWKNIDDIKVLSHSFSRDQSNNLYAGLDLLKSYEDTMHLSKRFIPTDSLRFVAPSKVIKEFDDKILLLWREQTMYKNNGFSYLHDDHASAFSLIMLNKTVFDITSSNQEVGEYYFEVFPNPVSNLLTISYGDMISGRVILKDLSGRTMLQEELTNVDLVRIDLSSFPSGMYFLITEDTIGKKKYKVKKVIKV